MTSLSLRMEQPAPGPGIGFGNSLPFSFYGLLFLFFFLFPFYVSLFSFSFINRRLQPSPRLFPTSLLEKRFPPPPLPYASSSSCLLYTHVVPDKCVRRRGWYQTSFSKLLRTDRNNRVFLPLCLMANFKKKD